MKESEPIPFHSTLPDQPRGSERFRWESVISAVTGVVLISLPGIDRIINHISVNYSTIGITFGGSLVVLGLGVLMALPENKARKLNPFRRT